MKKYLLLLLMIMSTHVFATNDGIKVVIIGSGTCAPHPSRGTPANYISLDGKQFMIDGGAGSLHALARAGIDYAQLDGIFYTHFHPDHIAGLMPLLQALLWDPTLQRTKDFTIYGPKGLQAHLDDLKNLFQEHNVPKDFNLIIRELHDQDEVKCDDTSIKAFYVPHTQNSLGYRFTSSEGKVVAFSGDTGYGQEVVNVIQNADIAILECSWSDESYNQAVSKVHLSPTYAGMLAQQGCVKKLILTHIYPDTDNLPIKEICAKAFDGEIVVAQDFDTFWLTGKTKIIGHRGAPAYATENTIPSFQKALELGVWAIELDIRRCKSGELVLMHDADVDRVAHGHGLIQDKTLDELQSLTLKNGGTVPTLNQVLDIIGAQVNVILDLKQEDIANDIATLIHECVATKGWAYENFFATGFEHRELKRLRDLVPGIRLVPALAGTPLNLSLTAKELDAHAICLLDIVFSQALFDDARKQGFPVWVYLSNEQAENIKKFKSMGVDAIMINDPEKNS